jgi:transposase
MDDHLRLESLSAATLRMLLVQERAHRQELEQEVARLRAGLARQNEVILQLERENAQLRREQQELRGLVAALTEQNALLRQQVAALQQENEHLRGVVPKVEHHPDPWPSERTKHAERTTPRKKRDARHNTGRRRMARVDAVVEHRLEECPGCGGQLVGGWIQRRVQVIELPSEVRARVIEHQVYAHWCQRCRRRVVASPPGLEAGRIGQRRFGPRLIAAVAVMASVERLPIGQIQARLAREYDLQLSRGGIVGLLRLAAQQAEPTYQQLRATTRASPVVHADETGWRQDGIPGYVWTCSTPTTCYFHYDASRAKAVPDGILGEDFGGTLVTDFYGVYDHYLGPKQRCWSHLWRDIRALEKEHPADTDLAAWVTGIRTLYAAAAGPRPVEEEGSTPEAARARAQRARRYEQQILVLCPEDLAADRPEVTLAKRLRTHLPELFTFVRDPLVPPTNNAAERMLRPLVIARKVSGGTRSAAGSQTRMILTSVTTTARLQGQQPTQVIHDLLLAQSSSLSFSPAL